jgi:hypothetical protein
MTVLVGCGLRSYHYRGQRRAGRAPQSQPGTTVPLKLAAISISIRIVRAVNAPCTLENRRVAAI